MCGAFLWPGSPNDVHKAKKSWVDVCYPKEEGGLGIIRLRETFMVFSLRLIWRFFSSSDSLWVSWTKHYLMQEGSLWDAKDGSKGSWMWKKLLKLRGVVYPFIKFQVCNGRDVYFWFDDWLHQGKFLAMAGDTVPQMFGIAHMAKVDDVVIGLESRLRRQRGRPQQHLATLICATSIPQDDAGPD